MNPEIRTYKRLDRYGMPLCPYWDTLQDDEGVESSAKRDPLTPTIAKAMELKKEGKYDKALEQFESILKKRITTLGHDHPETCYVRNNLAHVHLKRKSYDEAFKLHIQIKSAFIDRCCLIYELYHEGEYEKALHFTQTIYDHMVHVSNSRDGEALQIRTLTANIYSALNKYKDALKIYEEVYQAYYHKDGPDHEDTMAVHRMIGLVLQDQGKLDEALKIFKDVLDKRLKKLGHEHEDTLASHKDIAELLTHLGKYDKALDIYRDVYIIECRIHPEHPATLDTKCKIAKTLSIKGNYEEALRILSVVYEIQRNNGRHLDIRTTMDLAASVLKDKGNPSSALNLYLKLYGTQKNPNHTFTLEIEKNVASMLLRMDHYDEALQIFLALHSKSVEVLGPEHTKTLEVQYNVARILFLKGDLDRALKIFNIIYEIQERRDFLGPDHPHTLRTKLSIADVYSEQELYLEALDIYYEVLEKRLLVLSAGHEEILQIQCDIAAVYRNQTNYDKSFQMYYDVYEKRARILGNLHPDTLAVERVMDILSNEMPSAKLLGAAYRNEMKVVKTCVEQGDDINVRDIDGSVALHLASRQGHLEIIEYLLEKGAIYNATDREGKRPVDVSKNDEVKRLFNAVDMLLKAIKSGNYPLVARFTGVEKARINAKDEAGCTPLHWAASMGCKKTVAFLLERGADFMSVSKNGNTALHLAASRSFKDVAETLLSFVKENHPENLKNFINAKTNVLGTTSLHSAAQNNHYATTKLLLQYGADTRIRNKFGKFPVDATTRHDIKTMLIARDATIY